MDIEVKTKPRVCAAEAMGKLPTFSVIVDVTDTGPLDEILGLPACKKSLEL